MTAIVLLTLGASACSDDGDGSDASPTSRTPSGNPGPNPTPAVDPGPNDTADGPFTREGTVVLPAGADCITLRTDEGDLDVAIDGYTREEAADGPAVVDDDGTVWAHDGDTMIVAGYGGTGTSTCGAAFEAESLVTVTPE